MTVILDFDLQSIDAHDRLQFWHDIGSRIYRPCLKFYEEASPLCVQSKMIIHEDIVMGFMKSSPQSYERTFAMIRRDCVDGLMLTYLVRGSYLWRSNDQLVSADPGSFVLMDLAQVCQSQWGFHEQLYVSFPRDVLSPCGERFSLSTAVLPSTHPYADILATNLKWVWKIACQDQLSQYPELLPGFTLLTKKYFHAFCSLQHDANARLSDAALVSAIKIWIDSNLGDQRLDIEAICRTFYVSRTRLYRLFSSEDGIKKYVQERRLVRAMNYLTSFSKSTLSVRAIAGLVGFSSHSVFTRAFYKRWQITPTMARNGSLQRTLALDSEVPGALSAEGSLAREQLTLISDRYYRQIEKQRTLS